MCGVSAYRHGRSRGKRAKGRGEAQAVNATEASAV